MATRANLFKQLHACIELDTDPIEFTPGKPKRSQEKNMGPAVIIERNKVAKETKRLPLKKDLNK